MAGCFCLTIYDWNVTRSELIKVVTSFVRDIGSIELKVNAKLESGQSQVIDLFSIKDLISFQSLEYIGPKDQVVQGLSYIDDRRLLFRCFFLAFSSHGDGVEQARRLLTDLSQARCAGYAIGFDSDDAQQGLYYALGITSGLPITNFEKLRADQLSRFFRQTSIRDPQERSYNREKIRGLYPINELSLEQYAALLQELSSRGLDLPAHASITPTADERFILVSLSSKQASSYNELLVGSPILI